MKKFILSALMSLSCGVLFAAETATTDMYLFWMINKDQSIGDTTAAALAQSGEYTARLSVQGAAGTYLNLYDNDLQALTQDSTKGTVALSDVVNWETVAAVGGYENSSFFVELLNAGDVVYRSEYMAYANLGDYLSSMKGMSKPAEGAYAFGNFTAVPEPTSGLLLLLGVAGLALRRKKMQKA